MLILRHVLNVIARGSLSVFLFHKVPPTTDPLLPSDPDRARFEIILDFIAGNFKIHPLADAVRLLGRGKLPARSAAITFDDGYLDWLGGVALLLSRRSIPATFFITTGQLEGRPMWHERLANIVRTFPGEVLDTRLARLSPLNTGTPAERVTAVQALEFHFKYLPPVIRDRLLFRLEESVGATANQVPVMSPADLATIANLGFEIGAHTIDHPILGLCDSDRAVEEIGRAREFIEGIIKRPVRSFAYPNGRPGVDFSLRHIEMIKSAGYDYAVTTQWGTACTTTSPYQIPRFTPWGPSRRMMSFQLLRNMFTEPESIREVCR